MPQLVEVPVSAIDDSQVSPRHGEPSQFVLDDSDVAADAHEPQESDEPSASQDSAARPRDMEPDVALKALARSVREVGVLQPVHVFETEPGRYRLIMGGRRLRAAKAAGKSTVPALVWGPGEAPDLELMVLTENLHRADWDPIERAEHLNRYMKRLGLSQAQLAKRLGLPRITVRRWLSAAQVDPKHHDDLRSGRLPLTVAEEAYAAARREGRPERADELIAQYLQGATRSELRELERGKLSDTAPEPPASEDGGSSPHPEDRPDRKPSDAVWEWLQQLGALTNGMRRVRAVHFHPSYREEFQAQLRSLLLALDDLVRNLFRTPLVQFVAELLGQPSPAGTLGDGSAGGSVGGGDLPSATPPRRGGRQRRTASVR